MTKKRAERLLKSEVEVRLNPDAPGYHFAYADGIGVTDTNEEKVLQALVDAVLKVRSRAVAERARYRCERCGRLTGLQTHHKVFRSHGGTHEVDNLEALCHDCHQKQHNRKVKHGT